MKNTVYIETTIPSYATARESRDPRTRDWQELTRAFWEDERDTFRYYTSQETHDECKDGDRDAAARRLKFLEGIKSFPITDEVKELADTYKKLLDIPDRAKRDSVHMAVCVLRHIDFLLSWNCTHMGPLSQKKLAEFNSKHNLWTPTLVTPENIMDFIKARSETMEETDEQVQNLAQREV